MTGRTSITTPKRASRMPVAGDHLGQDDSAPTVPGSIARNWLLVVALTVVACGVAIAYTLHVPKSFDAKASIAMVQPANAQGLGPPVAANAEQYVESQVLVLQSDAVARNAATVANATIHRAVFTAADFTGQKKSLKVTTQSSTQPNSGVVTISYSAPNATEAAIGANAVVRAYQDAYSAGIQNSYSSIIQAIDSTVQGIDSQLRTLAGKNDPLDNQLVASLINQRSIALQSRSQAVVNEQVALAQPLSVVGAYTPADPANRKLVQNGAIGAIAGFVVGAILSFGIESHRRRWLDARRRSSYPATGNGSPADWDSWNGGDGHSGVHESTTTSSTAWPPSPTAASQGRPESSSRG